jgi:hypothetical protein
MVLLATGCGGNGTKKPKEENNNTVVSTKVILPILGIVEEASETEFILLTTPLKFEDPVGKTKVYFKPDIVVDTDGKTMALYNGATVNIEGTFENNAIYASRITVSSKPETTKLTLEKPKNLTLETAKLLKSIKKLNLPDDFEKNWMPGDFGNIQNKPGAIVHQYSKGQWKIILVDDPGTQDKFEITLYGPNKLVWTGKQDNSGKITETK